MLAAGSFMHFVLAFVLIFGLALGIGIENDNTTQLGTISPAWPSNVTALDNGVLHRGERDVPGQAGRAAGRRQGDRPSTASR